MSSCDIISIINQAAGQAGYKEPMYKTSTTPAGDVRLNFLGHSTTIVRGSSRDMVVRKVSSYLK